MAIENFRQLAAYNHWANLQLYGAALQLPEQSYRRPVGVFFGSLHGTLNHLLLTDRIWLRRLTGDGDHPATLDAILYDDRDAFVAAPCGNQIEAAAVRQHQIQHDQVRAVCQRGSGARVAPFWAGGGTKAFRFAPARSATVSPIWVADMARPTSAENPFRSHLGSYPIALLALGRGRPDAADGGARADDQNPPPV